MLTTTSSNQRIAIAQDLVQLTVAMGEDATVAKVVRAATATHQPSTLVWAVCWELLIDRRIKQTADGHLRVTGR
jgi:hypothetical protein